jgi:hypothetical protein
VRRHLFIVVLILFMLVILFVLVVLFVVIPFLPPGAPQPAIEPGDIPPPGSGPTPTLGMLGIVGIAGAVCIAGAAGPCSPASRPGSPTGSESRSASPPVSATPAGCWTVPGVGAATGAVDGGRCWEGSPDSFLEALETSYSDVHAAISADFEESSRFALATTVRMSLSLPMRNRSYRGFRILLQRG